jgi:hypothetical protein
MENLWAPRSKLSKRKNLHAKNGSSTSNIQNYLVLEKVGILVDSILIRIGAHFIFLAKTRVSALIRVKVRMDITNQHLLVDAFIAAKLC